jgi:hypothetical protein
LSLLLSLSQAKMNEEAATTRISNFFIIKLLS